MPENGSLRGRRSALFGAILLATLGSPKVVEAEIGGGGSLWLRDGAGRELLGDTWSADHLGLRIAIGDWNGDGRDDLALSDFEQDDLLLPGSVHVIYSSASGAPLYDEHWEDFDPVLLLPDVEEFDAFGFALAAGDWNGDGFDDLAIGIPGEVIGPAADAGMVLVLYGTAEGLAQAGAPLSQRWRIGGGMTAGAASAGDQFGAALAAGDFDGDGFDDLAVGIPTRDVGVFVDAGSVLALYGGVAGLSGDGHRFFDQDSAGADGTMEEAAGPGDRFGEALAAGDFDHDGRDDLAIGAPGEALSAGANEGVVQTLYGFPGPVSRGLRLTGNQVWDEATLAAGGAIEPGDRFGSTLVAGDLNGDGVDDLVVGAPLEEVAGTVAAGAVTIVCGNAASGLVSTGAIYLHENHLAGEAAELENHFGSALAIGDFVADDLPLSLDLAVGVSGQWKAMVPGDHSLPKVGAVSILRVQDLALPVQAARLTPGVGGVAGEFGANLRFGIGLGGGDFDGDGHADLAVGAPGTDDPSHGAEDSGALHLLFGALFADGFETATTLRWSATSP